MFDLCMLRRVIDRVCNQAAACRMSHPGSKQPPSACTITQQLHCSCSTPWHGRSGCRAPWQHDLHLWSEGVACGQRQRPGCAPHGERLAVKYNQVWMIPCTNQTKHMERLHAVGELLVFRLPALLSKLMSKLMSKVPRQSYIAPKLIVRPQEIHVPVLALTCACRTRCAARPRHSSLDAQPALQQ